MRPALDIRQNSRNHRKICIIDGVVGFTGGCNIADEYINLVDRFGKRKDNILKIKGRAVNGFVNTFISDWNVFFRETEKIENRENYLFESNISLRNDVSDIKKNELFKITKEDIKELNEDTKDVCLPGDARQKLEQMIGLESVKKVINKAAANFKFNKLCMERGISKDKASLHMVFTGNPGTAKTTVARLFANILKDEKVLSSGIFVETGRADLVGDHVGSTAKLVKRKFKEAQGGVLFIDEAYSLCDGHTGGFGDEAINTLVQEMENHREDVIVIFAGYPKPMEEFLDRNPGMKSRIAFEVQFEDYTVDELVDIAKLMVSDKNMSITEEAIAKLRSNFEIVSKSEDYGNGRYVRKMLEEAEMNLAERCFKYDVSDITDELLTTIEAEDIPETKLNDASSKIRIGFAC